jgi:hypothetical protein
MSASVWRTWPKNPMKELLGYRWLSSGIAGQKGARPGESSRGRNYGTSCLLVSWVATWCLMTSLYDLFADDCARIAAKTKAECHKSGLLRLADQWRAMEAEQTRELGKSAVLATPKRR